MFCVLYCVCIIVNKWLALLLAMKQHNYLILNKIKIKTATPILHITTFYAECVVIQILKIGCYRLNFDSFMVYLYEVSIL